MKIYTITDLRALKPCYDPATKLSESWTGTILDILKDNRIPDEDKIWTASKVLDEKTLRLFAADCAEYAVNKLVNPVDPRTIAAIKAARDFACGLIDDAAYSAARSAAYSAADSAADSAAYSAAESAADSAAYSAARSAADSAARSAAYSAADSAAYSAADSAAESAAYSAACLFLIKLITPVRPELQIPKF